MVAGHEVWRLQNPARREFPQLPFKPDLFSVAFGMLQLLHTIKEESPIRLRRIHQVAEFIFHQSTSTAFPLRVLVQVV